MSAIEMMDPKMDAGMLCNQISRKVYNLEQAVEVSLSCVLVENITTFQTMAILVGSFIYFFLAEIPCIAIIIFVNGYQELTHSLLIKSIFIPDIRCMSGYQLA